MQRRKKKKIGRISKSLSIAKTILAIMGEAGEVTVKAFFPHPYYHTFCNHSNCKKRDYGAFSSNVSKLEKRGLIKRKQKEGSTIFYLTPEGEKEAFLARTNLEVISNKFSKNDWDGKWRFIFFDIPESKRYYRDCLRGLIKSIGFKEFQKSVWAYPFPIPSLLSDILWDENIRPYTRFIVVDDIDYEDDLKGHFFAEGS